MDAATRAIPWQAKHNQILARITPDILQSDETLRDIADRAANLVRDYTISELAFTGTVFPMNWDVSNPEHAIIIANRRDIQDTEDRLRFQLSVRSSDRYWTKHMKEIDPFNLGGIKTPTIKLGAGLALGGFALAALALYLIFKD